MRAMVHRGPDDSGCEQLLLGNDGSGSVAGFGFRRLVILDLSPTSDQPMVHPTTGDFVIEPSPNRQFVNRPTLAEVPLTGIHFR